MIKSLITKFKACLNRYELDELIKIFSQQDKYALLLGSSIEFRKELASTLRNKIITLIFLEGDIADKKYREYLYVYGLFEGLDLEPEDLLDGYTSLISQHLQSNNLEIVEKFLLLEVRALAFMLQGKTKMAIRGYLEEAIKIDLHQLMGTGVIEFLRGFFHFFPISIEEVLEAMRHNLEKNDYFLLDPVARRSIFCWALHFFWLNPRFFYNTQWSELYPLVKILFMEHFKRNELDEAMYLQFFMTATNASLFQTQEQWKVYNQEIIKSAEPFYKEYAKTLPLCKEKIRPMGKKIIGILKERAVANSPYKVELSLLKALMQDTQFTEAYDVKIYMMGYVEHGFDDLKIIKSYKDIGIEVVNVVKTILAKSIYYHSHLEKALAIRDRILKDEVDILIFTNDCYDINDFLMVSRCAPTQIYWSHGNFQYDIEGIDKRISHISAIRHLNVYNFQQIYISQNTKINLKLENLNIEILMGIKNKFPQNKIILGSIGRLVKLDSDEYFQKLVSIMMQRPETIYLACGSGNQAIIEQKIQLYELEGRFFFSGFIDPRIYAFVIDIYLDTFPEPSGEALVEYHYLKSGFGIVHSLEKDYVRKALYYIDRLYCSFSFQDFYESLTLVNPLKKNALYLEKDNACYALSIAFYCPPSLFLDKNLLTPILELIKRVKEAHFSIYTSCRLSKKFDQILFNEIDAFDNVLLLDIELLNNDFIKKNYDLVLLYQNIELNYDEYPKEYSFLWFSAEIFSSNKSYLDYFYPNGIDREFNLLLMDICKKFGVAKEVIGILIQESTYLTPFEYYVMLLKELAKSKNLLVAYQSFANQNKISSELISSREFIGIISKKHED